MRNFIIIRKISIRKIDLYNKANAMLPHYENFVYTISLVQHKTRLSVHHIGSRWIEVN